MVLINTIDQTRRSSRLPLSAVRRGSAGARPTVGYYDVAERRKILAAASHLMLDRQNAFPFSYMVGMIMHTGMPLSELLELRWEPASKSKMPCPWVDMKGWEIIVPATNGSRRKRRIPVIPPLGRLLADWPLPKSGKLFPFTVTGEQLNSLWGESLALSGVRRAGIQNLRNSFVVTMREAGLSASETMEILG